MNKRFLSLLLAVVMVVAMLPANALAVQSGSVLAPSESGSLSTVNEAKALDTTGPLSLGVSSSAPSAEQQTGFSGSALVQSATEGDLTKFELQSSAAREALEKAQRYSADDKVTFIVVTEDAPLLEKFSARDIAVQTASVNAHLRGQENNLDAVKAQAKRVLGADMKLGFTYTIGTTGFSVETSYGNLSKLQAMDGVKTVYVAPTFSLPEDMGEQKLSPMTANSATMIGADILNESGYTGRGMRIAILDTGILESHPSFQAMDESKLDDPMTRESVEEIWDTLNASQKTHMLNVSYKSNKIPYAFNYAAGTFDVDNIYAGSDHGTHVAGISAANAVEGSTVKGMAPDAQLVVMQVFNNTGGAGWETIMAALEDCVRLEVDAANLSLGSAAGFTDPDDAMLETMNLFLSSDIHVLIASGNDTNNAYMNLWGRNMSLISNPDIGLAGTPSTYSSSLAVASANNNGSMMLYFTLNGTDYGFQDTATTSATSFIQNFMGETLEYVMVPGIGAAEDYEGIDVSGKIAVISRGSSSFPEKQSIAQSMGATGCIIYNNTAGLFLMQINDGQGNIPCVSVSRSAGEALAAAENKTLTVCNADTKHFISDTVMSDFSSWGVTPDLKLKPEITGVGGNIYSATHPSISGSNYGYMSGTSMATPQITGAMAILLQYLEANYPELTGSEQRVVATNLMMSTASPILHANGLEYSPRNQGAGLADMVNATTAEGYLSNPAAAESRPKVEFGDDDQKNGVYEFTFELTNMANRDRTFALSSSLLTETIAEEWFIANEPYALESEVVFSSGSNTPVLCYDFNDDGAITTADARIVLQFAAGTLLIDESNAHYGYLDVNADGTVDSADAKVITDYCAELEVSVDLTAVISSIVNQITVPAGETVAVSGKIVLNDTDKAYLNSFPNGIFVEGFVYASEVGLDTENTVSTRLTMPIVGFYGDWSAADVFDRDDLGSYSLYPTQFMANYSDIGYNPYFRNGRSGDEYSYLSYSNALYALFFGQLRNTKRMVFSVTDNATGETYHTLDVSYLTKTHFNTSAGMIIPTYLEAGYGEMWDGKTADGRNLPDGTSVTYKAEAWLDDGDDILDDTLSFQLTMDNSAPEILNASELQENLIFEGARTYLTLDILENEKLAAVIFITADDRVMGKYELENVPGETLTHTFDITGFGNSFSIIAADYACNETEIDAFLNLGEQNNAHPEPQELSSDRLYGCETFDGALVEGGWFSANKADLSDPRNETFDSNNRYYSAEYINGYLMAQNANTGDLELVTPSGTYWGTQTLVDQSGSVGDAGVWVLYDMAMDYSDNGSAIYDQWGSASGKDTLYAVGWSYKGDNNGDGKDDGYNALFRIWMSRYNGMMFVDECGQITGTNGTEILTLGITTEGDMYGISTDACLYAIDPANAWDDSVSNNVVNATYVGTTDFVTYPGYGGANVIQSMGYDHNTDTMYWYAHSQVANGAYYENINVTYKVDLTDGSCTEVGTYGPGGQTCLFVPHDMESDMFTMGVNPTSVSMSEWQLTMVEGQTKRLTLSWDPWNAAPQDVTWASSDESIATVDEYGFVTAQSAGTATVTATTQVWDDWEGVWGTREVTCNITVKASEQAIYGYVMADYSNPINQLSWATYADNKLHDITVLGKSYVNGSDMDDNPVNAEAMWAGGTYYNGYVYSVEFTSWEEDGMIHNGSRLYRSKVTEGATPAETVIGQPEYIGSAENMEISAMGFDYNTGRMYCVENRYIGGLGIIDLDTGAVDMLGLPNGAMSGAVYIPGLCVTRDGTIVISDAVANLYTIDPDTLTTTQIYTGNGDMYTAYYEAMMYDYNTDVIYWNMCDGFGVAPLYMVMLGQNEWSGEPEAEVVNLGGVSSKNGTQQTILFAIPENEPETTHIPVESIEITDGDSVTGLVGGTRQLTVVTNPLRPTVQAKTWTSSNEDVVTVDRYGVLTYKGIGTATVTVSITNKDEEAHGGPFTDSIEVTVLESAGKLDAFLAYDMEGTGYYDFWISMNDYDLRHASVHESMINILSLRTGIYYDGYYYAYNNANTLMRIDADNHTDFVTVGGNGLTGTDESGNPNDQITGMALDYATGTVYAVTLSGMFGTVDLNTGMFSQIGSTGAEVYALACDDEGILYAAGGSTLYTMDTETGACTAVAEIPGATIITGPCYMGEMMYNTQMAYDFGTDRLYINATYDSKNYSESSGMYMVDLSGETPVASHLGGISLYTRAGSELKYGQVFLSLLASIPEADEIPVASVNGIILNKRAGRVAVGGTATLTAEIRPSNALDTSVTWSSSDESVATVDANGVVTGVGEGTATITVTSNETGVTAECVFTVVDISGEQSVAYTISAQKDALVSFNPALPAQTAEVVTTLSGGSNISGMAYGDNCLYYVEDMNNTFYIYRYDFITKQSTSLGFLEAWTGVDDIAYDAENNLLYAVGGFYLYQYDVSKFAAGQMNPMSNFFLDSDYCTMAGVTVVDGAVYTLGNNYGTPQLMKYADKYLSTREVVLKGFALNAVAGSTEMAYDASADLFYVTDAGSTIYSFDLNNRVQTGEENVWNGSDFDLVPVYTTDVTSVDILGDGIDINGLAIIPAAE